MRIGVSMGESFLVREMYALNIINRQLCTTTGTSSDQIMARVIGLVKGFDRIDATKVTETADFQKDLSLDSLDRVELVMAIEQEFSVEIPEEKADKLKCCADVTQYIISEADQNIAEDS
ncbi:acyl carrier protein 3, mitochondrial [Apium graveolens]|uniref:acyl carrier protein 3, mitochondrial n=1 Tax=Apium graveolens TaxID=4045 RepID=UPI003D790FAF